jgi:hypothetical protein
MTEETAENAYKYVCKKCDFKCSKLSNYNCHLLTLKHKRVTTSDKNQAENLENDIKQYICKICNKEYKSRNGLWLHKQKCKKEDKELNTETQLVTTDNTEDITVTDAKIVFELLKQNNEFKEFIVNHTNQIMTQMMDQSKSMMEIVKTCNTTNNINNGQIQNNNNHFNIQMYLNETCKNAMTIDEFLDYLQPTIEELEDTARLGYVEGITRIIMRGLKDLEEELRPFHCSDLKRESLFVKNPDGEWEKETDEKPLMLKFVKAVARKNFNNVNEWRKLHPNCRFHDSKSNDMFNQIMLNSTSGRTEEEQKASYEKIIKNITKEAVINKKKYTGKCK